MGVDAVVGIGEDRKNCGREERGGDAESEVRLCAADTPVCGGGAGAGIVERGQGIGEGTGGEDSRADGAAVKSPEEQSVEWDLVRWWRQWSRRRGTHVPATVVGALEQNWLRSEIGPAVGEVRLGNGDIMATRQSVRERLRMSMLGKMS